MNRLEVSERRLQSPRFPPVRRAHISHLTRAPAPRILATLNGFFWLVRGRRKRHHRPDHPDDVLSTRPEGRGFDGQHLGLVHLLSVLAVRPDWVKAQEEKDGYR